MKTTTTIKVSRLFWDASDEDCAGWYAEYSDANGVVTDSLKGGHPALPDSPDAEDEARAIADAYCAALNK